MAHWLRFERDGRRGFGTLRDGVIEIFGGDMFGDRAPTKESVPLSAVSVRTPCDPSKMICLWNNFRALATKLGSQPPNEPLYLLKAPSAFLGQEEIIRRPKSYDGKVVYEGELGIVIGKRCTDIGEDRSIYLFQAPGLDGRTPLESVDKVVTLKDYATLYVEAMRTLQPTGPYHIAAMCSGSFIAVEMCEQLEQAGQAVRRLILLDPTAVPPVMKPAAIETLREKKRAKRAKRKLGARILDLLRGPSGDDELEEDYDPWEMPPKRREELRQRIEQRVAQMTDIPPEQRSFTAERMFRMSQQFRAALYTYVPRPYPGDAILLVSAIRGKETLADDAFWPNNLGSMRYEVLGSKHKDLFEEKLTETAQFVRDALN